jgi:hypothetical protein
MRPGRSCTGGLREIQRQGKTHEKAERRGRADVKKD